MHTGRVALTVELHDTEPPLGAGWEEVVEASFHPSGEAFVVSWAGENAWPLDLSEADYRVRYSAAGMDEAREANVMDPGQPCLDRYLLQFWPAPPAPDRVVRQTSRSAAYWHENARKQPKPDMLEG